MGKAIAKAVSADPQFAIDDENPRGRLLGARGARSSLGRAVSGAFRILVGATVLEPASCRDQASSSTRSRRRAPDSSLGCDLLRNLVDGHRPPRADVEVTEMHHRKQGGRAVGRRALSARPMAAKGRGADVEDDRSDPRRRLRASRARRICFAPRRIIAGERASSSAWRPKASGWELGHRADSHMILPPRGSCGGALARQAGQPVFIPCAKLSSTPCEARRGFRILPAPGGSQTLSPTDKTRPCQCVHFARRGACCQHGDAHVEREAGPASG